MTERHDPVVDLRKQRADLLRQCGVTRLAGVLKEGDLVFRLFEVGLQIGDAPVTLADGRLRFR